MLLRHVRRSHPRRELHLLTLDPGDPVLEVLPRFLSFHVLPRRRSGWTYGSIGAWEVTADTGHGYEFFLLAPRDDPQLARLISMIAHYHANPDDETFRLGHGHTIPIGEPFLGGSCDHFLLSKPYTIGPEFEVCHVSDELHVQFLWMLPITKAERDFAGEHSLEELEQRFEAVGIEYLDPHRDSVV